jgi:hypothetical protein
MGHPLSAGRYRDRAKDFREGMSHVKPDAVPLAIVTRKRRKHGVRHENQRHNSRGTGPRSGSGNPATPADLAC